MTLSHSVTVADVKRLYAEEADVVLPDGNKRTPAEVLQGTRTRVHELIASQSPCTYVLRAPVRAFAHHEHTARDADTTARKAELAASIPEALIIESERARSTPDGTHRDAVHYVQKKWGIEVWKEADRLMAQSGGAS